MAETAEERAIRARILELTAELEQLRAARRGFSPGEDYVSYAGKVYDEQEVVAAVDATLDFWLTLGPRGEHFQRELAKILGVRWSLLTNSGSSANLLAMTALGSHKLDRRILPGDEVITAACGFPTTVAPIVQMGAVPVFVDNDPSTGNAPPHLVEQAITSRTRAVMMAHTLGNPFDLDAIGELCRKHDLYLVEDNCDALGSTWNGVPTGSFGDVSTQSFYPPHHLTMGEGGSVNIRDNSRLKVAVESLRDWGRDCWCASGKDDTCGKRFDWQLGDLPRGYDHKYIYSHLGYNLKPLDIQAAIGLVQLQKLAAFTESRRANFQALRDAISPYPDLVRTVEPLPQAAPSWFGFLLVVEPGAPFDRNELAAHLERNRVATRMLFAGNLTRQPAFTQLAADARAAGRSAPFRVEGDLSGADRLMRDALFVGTYPGLTGQRLEWMTQTLGRFLQDQRTRARPSPAS